MRPSLSLRARSSLVFSGFSALLIGALAPSAAAQVQGMVPTADQPGVNFDGSGASCSGSIFTLPLNPEEPRAPGLAEVEAVALATGGVTYGVTDLLYPAELPWVIARSYSQKATLQGAEPPQGWYWFQNSQPEIRYDSTNNIVTLIYAADRSVAYKLLSGSSTIFVGLDGVGGFFERLAAAGTEPEKWVLTDAAGLEFTFIGFTGTPGDAAGQLWKIERPGKSGSAYVGSVSSARAAIDATLGWDSGGRIEVAFDSSGRKFAYTYATVGSATKLASVVVTTSSNVQVGQVDYAYYGDESFGDIGDLKTATVTLPLSDSGVNDIRTTYYRYWEGTFNATSNPGRTHELMLIVGPEGIRRHDWQDSIFDAEYLTENTNSLKSYSQAYFEYDSSSRVATGVFSGRCGCSGGGASGTYTYSYEGAPSFPINSTYDTAWHRRVIVGRPDGSFVTQYFDEESQTLSSVVSNINPASTSPAPSFWPTQVVRNSEGRVKEIWTPDSIATYTHTLSSVGFTADDSSSSDGGLVKIFTRVGTGAASAKISERRWADVKSNGTLSTSYLEETYTWNTTVATKDVGPYTYVRPLLSERRVFPQAVTSGTTGSHLTTVEYSMHSSPGLFVKKVTETQPTVSTTNHGSGSTHKVFTQLRHDGQVEYRSEKTLESSGKQIIERRTYTSDGQLSEVYEDADTSGISGLDADFQSSSPAFNDEIEMEYDLVGRLVSRTTHDGRTEKTYRSVLADRRLVTLQFPHFKTTPSASYAKPAGYTVANLAGEVEFSATLAASSGEYVTAATTAFIDETDSDPILAVGDGVTIGSLTNVRTRILDASGTRATASREYFLTPASGAGTEGTNYDSTQYAYDTMGRTIRTLEPHGTIHRSSYDARGLITARSIGTDDTGLDGGMTGGTSNMVTVEALTYDGGASGKNGYLTERTAYVESGTTGQRETTFLNDVRGRAIVTVNPTAPHSLAKYDNLGRMVGLAQFSSSSGLDTGDEPTEQSNRLSYSETSYDERGRVFQQRRHNITASTGVSADSIDTLTWYDEMGRVLKVDGETLVKYEYDRLNRRTREFVLASDDDTAHAHTADVVGDIVLEEQQSAFDSNHRVWASVTIDRLYNGVGTSPHTGALDSNADSDLGKYSTGHIEGRVQATAYWFDDLGREIGRAEYGTSDGSGNAGAFDRTTMGSTPPARSNDVLVTTTAYAESGLVRKVVGPRHVDPTVDPTGPFDTTFYEYDDAGRTVTEIANYVQSGTGVDENQTVRYGFTDGLMVTLTADLPTGETDQVTTYTYGVTKGTTGGTSRIAANHLLSKVQYPDSTDATNDIVGFAYNAQGEEIWRRDQALTSATAEYNVIETDYDAAGRVTARRVTKKRDITDGAVLRIGTAYDQLGRVDTVTQYNAASGGTAVDEVKYLYDGWGNVTNFRQDINSDVSGSGYWDVAYAYAKATGGRNTIRRTEVTLPGGEVFKYFYRSGTGSHDDKASRVTLVRDKDDGDLAGYLYNGTGHVVRTELSDVGIYSKAYDLSGTTFGRLDRFNRATISSWTRDLSPDREIYKVSIGYDRNSNITSQDDAVHTGHDVSYANDGLNRLTDAKEGTWNGSAIASPPTRQQTWTLSQTGNWTSDKLDLDGDGLYTGSRELNDTRTHNAVNELLTRDTNSSAPAEFNFAYDAAGNMTEDGVYKYEWDAFYRLRRVKNQSNALVSEYWYNGLGYLITRHQDTNGNGTAGVNDKKFHTAYDERWRQVATYREEDADPKERFVYHCAGDGGYGGSSYIDAVVLRDRDMTSDWVTGTADGTLEERIYYMQNWRADVVALVAPDGDGGATMVEWVKYSAYGVPFGLPAGDANSDGICDGADDTQVASWKNSSAYDVRGDLDLDGDVDLDDVTNVALVHQNIGRTALSSVDIANRKGYAGYEADAKLLGSKWHVRHRVLDSVLGRWLRRDPLGYVDGRNLWHYAGSRPVLGLDPRGTDTIFWRGETTGGWYRDPASGLTPGNPPPPGSCSFGPAFDLRQILASQPKVPLQSELEWDCCRAAHERGLRKVGFDNSNQDGGLICCQGIMIACSWQQFDNYDHNPSLKRWYARDGGGTRLTLAWERGRMKHAKERDGEDCSGGRGLRRVPGTSDRRRSNREAADGLFREARKIDCSQAPDPAECKENRQREIDEACRVLSTTGDSDPNCH